MRKAEVEAHYDEYVALESRIQAMRDARQFPGVFFACLASFPHIVPAIKYRKRAGLTPEMPRLLSFHVICQYAPLLFEHAAIESLGHFVRSTRLLAKHAHTHCLTSQQWHPRGLTRCNNAGKIMDKLGPRIRALAVEPLEAFKVRVTFENGDMREVDLDRYLHGPVFEPMRKDPAVFRSMKIDRGVITWQNGADIDPDVLYYNLTPAWLISEQAV